MVGFSLWGRNCWSQYPCPVYSDRESSEWPHELAYNIVIYTIYLFLAFGPLANCVSSCWISLEFNHALFSFQLNYLYIWLTFSLLGSQSFSMKPQINSCPLNFRPTSHGLHLSAECQEFISLLLATLDFGEKRMCVFNPLPRKMLQPWNVSGLTPSFHWTPLLAQDPDFYSFLVSFLLSGTKPYILLILFSQTWEQTWQVSG